MAHFYGTLQGARGEASRLGHAKSGLRTEACSWQGKVSTYLYEKDGVDYAHVRLGTHNGAGTDRTLYNGPVRGKQPETKGGDIKVGQWFVQGDLAHRVLEIERSNRDGDDKPARIRLGFKDGKYAYVNEDETVEVMS